MSTRIVVACPKHILVNRPLRDILQILGNLSIAFGAPMVRGIATWVLKGRWKAGESIEDIKEDFTLGEDEIKQGLQFEDIRI